jgi:hypothetical protein
LHNAVDKSDEDDEARKALIKSHSSSHLNFFLLFNFALERQKAASFVEIKHRALKRRLLNLDFLPPSHDGKSQAFNFSVFVFSGANISGFANAEIPVKFLPHFSRHHLSSSLESRL